MNFTFGGFAPDLDETTPNILTTGTVNVLPTARGYSGFPDWSPVAGVDALTSTAVGLHFARRTTKTNRLLAATASNIWERRSLSWVSVIPAGLTMSAVDRLQFAQVGDVTLAGAKATQSMQFESTTATTIVTMPRYDIIDTVGEFVMIGNVETSITYTGLPPADMPDRWWCSALGNYASWTPSIATQCATNTLLDVAGPLTAGRQLGERFVFYKQRGMWVGEYEGPPSIWGWRLASQEIGTYGQQCVVPVGYLHYFVGTDNIYVFDGAQARPIGTGMREWFFARLQKQHAAKIWGVHDEINNVVLWWYPGPGSAGELNEVIAFNYERNGWGYASTTMQAASSYMVDEMTWDQLWAGLTFGAIPNTTFDAAYFQASTFVPVVIDGSRHLSTLFGEHLDGSLKTSWAGDDNRLSLVRRMRMRWGLAPTSATLTPSRVMRQGDPEELGVATTMTNAGFYFTQNARWHRALVQTEGNWESPGLDADVVTRGRE